VAVVSWHVHTTLERFIPQALRLHREPIGPKQQVSVGGLIIDAGTCDVAALEE